MKRIIRRLRHMMLRPQVERPLAVVERPVLILQKPGFMWMAHNPKFAALSIGEWTYGDPTVSWHEPGRTLTIGRFCSIAPEVVIMLGGNHHTEWISTFPFAELMGDDTELPGHECTRGDVSIGHDVWIGQGALILSGVTIGDGAVIAAHSVVTRDVAPYSISGGNPARHLRYRVPEDAIADLLEIQWWNWPIEQIQAARHLLLSPRVDEFIAQYKSPSGNDTPA